MEFLFYARCYGYKDENAALGNYGIDRHQANKPTEFQTASDKDQKKELWEPRWTGTPPA